jgi:hypothetical protein
VTSGFFPRYLVYCVSPAAKPVALVSGVSLTVARAMAEQQAKARGQTVYIRNLLTGAVETVEPAQKTA